MKTKIILIIAAVLAAVLCLFLERSCSRASSLESQVRDLQVQLAHSQVPIKTDTIRDSIVVTTVRVVEVDKTDYKKQLADRQLIKDLQIKLSDVTAENRSLREMAGKVALHGADSDSVISYHDRWADFDFNRKSRVLDYKVRDSVVTYIDRIPKHKFLWWRWGTKGYKVSHVNFNPNAEVKFESFIMVNK
ncbi:MAG: hypothetical protein K5683_02950 [Prevotella sp.]|nr:hypothetical protein [Prevotella sp.]